MDGLKIYSKTELSALINRREGEVKLGERVQCVSTTSEMEASNAKFVLIGIPEDIGVRANYGLAGTASAWQPALKALLNIQSTPFLKGDELLVLGHFDFADPSEPTPGNLQKKVEEIDALVYPLIQKVVASGKIPIAIGGGHNNAYPLIKGTSMALNKPIDVINIDAHADLRPPQGRHSGNGFSYAIKEGYLKNYSIFGLHQNYNNNAILETISANHSIHVTFFDDLLQGDQPSSAAWHEFLKHSNDRPGLEIDLDAIANVLSSAMSPSGFSLNEIRRFILTAPKKFRYLHICEGAIALIDGRENLTTAKTIAYLISDFMKSRQSISGS